jgi:predicted metal-dependent phosphoesterase TrpH
LNYSHERGIKGIAGIEVAANWPEGHCHILGYGITNSFEPLETVLTKMRNDRLVRNEAICGALVNLGVDITPEEISVYAKGESMCRPHVARALIDKGVVASVQEAFERYLGKGKPAYVERFRLSPSELVKLLKSAGAIVILAHPVELKKDFRTIDSLVKSLKSDGLDGIEVYSPANNGYYNELLEIVERNDLLISGGSDFHGNNKPLNSIGHFSPSQKLSYDLLDKKSLSVFESLS